MTAKTEKQIFIEYCADHLMSVLDPFKMEDDIKNTFDFQRYRFQVRWKEFIDCLVSSVINIVRRKDHGNKKMPDDF